MISARPKEAPTEQRVVTRTRISKSAKIVLEASTVDCMLRNITARGACLEIITGDMEKLPRAFALSLDNCQSFRQCRVMWRQNQFVGVLF